MKLATLASGTADGRLVVVSRDGRRYLTPDSYETLQHALEDWPRAKTLLADLADRLAQGEGMDLAGHRLAAPLPRAWQWLDASAFLSHGALMERLFDVEARAPAGQILMYQGLSHAFLGATEDVPFPTEADGIDFEGEFAVVTDAVPMGIGPEEALSHVKLLLLVNDWSLRVIAKTELKTGFGWIQGKPACSTAPFAITPDELGEHWRDGRLHLDLHVAFNGTSFGHPNGAAMAFGMGELIAHAARTRNLCCGTIIGSGTVSNETYREVGSACIAERRAIEILDTGAAKTPFMRYGDTVRMEACLADGSSLFGAIEQRVVATEARS
jgi:fumarylacetoacetate (FAA) hydrolase